MTKLVLLGGPTGVGKSTVLRDVAASLPRCAVLDADDVWRVSSELRTPDLRGVAIGNVVGVMRGYFAAGCEIGIVAWVFAREALYQPVIDGLQDLVDTVQMIYLVADRATLLTRLTERGESDRLEYSLSRLSLIKDLPFTRIDTTSLSVPAVSQALCGTISSE